LPTAFDTRILVHLVIGRAPAEAAAGEAVVDEYFLRRQVGDLGGGAQGAERVLRPHPHIEPVGAVMRGGVQGFHRRVREIGHLVDRLDLLARPLHCRIDVAVIARAGARAVERGAIILGELGAVGRAAWTQVPLDLERVGRLLGAPEPIGHHGHRVVERHHRFDAAHGFRRRVIHALERAARHRAGDHRGVDHARQLGVDAVGGRAVDLERHVEARGRLAGQGELLRRLDVGLLVERDLGRVRRQRAIAEGAAGRLVVDLAELGLAGRGVDAPALGRHHHQPHAGRRAHLLLLLVRIPHRMATDR